MNEHEISDEDIFKAEVLGYMSEDRLKPIGLTLIEKARENPERLAAAIEEVVLKLEDSPAITWLFRHLFTRPGPNDAVKTALLRSPAVNRWIKKNLAVLQAAIQS
jgi:hypothetical protein